MEAESGLPANPEPDTSDPWVGRWESDVLLSDGTTVHVRPIHPDDGARLVALHSRLSAETIYMRFFSAHPRLSAAEVHRFTHVDGSDRMALVATGAEDALVAVARYDRPPGAESAEAAFLVEDAFQGKGIATVLLEHLAAYAREQGIHRFVAETLFTNAAMRRVFRQVGFAETVSYADGVAHVEMSLDPTPALAAATEERDRAAVVRSVQRLLKPSSVAVIGASRRAGTIGHEILANLVRAGFTGRLYAVNPHATDIAGVAAYPAIGAVAGPVDLAVVVVPASQVSQVVVDCGRKGVGTLVVISAGFAEKGGTGVVEQKALARLAHSYGLRMVGPNCMGVINTDPAVALNATFAAVTPMAGSLGFCSQSGGLGVAILGECARRGLGLSSFVSMGNKADLSGNDLLRYWEGDPATSVALLYLESIGNPRAFRRVAERFSRAKPIVAVKSGRSAAGVRSASSHTAALASPDAAVDALFRATGVIRVDRLEELFDTAAYLSSQPPPPGPRVAIVGNSGGPGTLAADACEARGLTVPELAEQTRASLRSFLSPDAVLTNPVDMVASAGPADYERAVSLLAADPNVDAVMAIFTPPIVTRAEDVARAVARAAGGTDKPVVANFLAGEAVLEALACAGGRPVPQFAYPESAADALARALEYGRWRARPARAVRAFTDVHRDEAVRVATDFLGARPEGAWLEEPEASRVLSAYGIAHGPGLRAGEVATGGDGAPRPDGAMEAAAPVQPTGRVGLAEVMVGGLQDPAFGPLVLFGAGGTMAELAEDRRLASAPLTDLDARELVSSSRVARLLQGWRGGAPADVDALVEFVERVSLLLTEVPEVAELDLDPVLAGPDGPLAVGYQIRLSRPAHRPDLAVRRLR